MDWSLPWWMPRYGGTSVSVQRVQQLADRRAEGTFTHNYIQELLM
jgi:hypothetical protein